MWRNGTHVGTNATECSLAVEGRCGYILLSPCFSLRFQVCTCVKNVDCSMAASNFFSGGNGKLTVLMCCAFILLYIWPTLQKSTVGLI